jgi:8-hydroxy-5-deazaflavin:NADPH oxidoreductase
VYVGILGGTGPAGQALAVRLASVGCRVVIGSRSADKAATVCDELRAKWPGHDLDLTPATNPEAAKADLVVVATQWEASAATAASVAAELRGKVVVSMGNALAKVDGELRPVPLPTGSVAAAVQDAVPSALVATAFNHIPARDLGRLDRPLEGDVIVCADHPAAADATADLVRTIPGLRPVRSGSLALAGTVEGFTAVLIGIHRRAGLRLTGIGD